MNALLSEKTSQAINILNELDIDLWLTFVRETSAGADPVLPLIYGHDLTWQSALIFTKTGEKIAIVGTFEKDTASGIGAYDTVIPYDKSIRPILLDTLKRISPKKIAINYSKSDVYSDGLGYGLYQVLLSYLEGSPFQDRLVSARPIISALRGRKTPAELDRIRDAVRVTAEIYETTFSKVRNGMSEAEIASIMHTQVDTLGLELSWDKAHCPSINAGAESSAGHVIPSSIKLKPGDLLHFDFGVRKNGYCSDIQRLAYLPSTDHPAPPPDLLRAFNTVVESIEKTVSAVKPGVPGHRLDQIARQTLLEAGYEEFKHATGHQVGRQTHDGGAVIGPLWERYGDTPNWPMETGQVYTIEPSIIHPEFGVVALEEMILVTQNGAEFLSTPQTELEILRP